VSPEHSLLHQSLCDDLERIAAKFKHRPRITLLVRQPGNPNGTVFLSDDNYVEAVAAMDEIQRNYAYAAGPAAPAKDGEVKP
jgi:hypothetical protein